MSETTGPDGAAGPPAPPPAPLPAPPPEPPQAAQAPAAPEPPYGRPYAAPQDGQPPYQQPYQPQDGPQYGPQYGQPAQQPWGSPPPAGPPYGAQPQWGGQPQPQWGAPPSAAPAPPGWGTQPLWGGQPWGGQPWGAAPAPGGPPGTPAAAPWDGGGPQMWLARPKPGIVPLRPLGLGEILDGAFQAIRTNPRTMIGVSAVVVAVATLLSSLPSAALLVDAGSNAIFTPGAAPTPGDLGSLYLDLIGAQLPTYLVFLLATALLGALLTIAVSNAVLGVRTGAGELWRRIRGRLGGIVLLAVLVTLLSVGSAGVCLGPGLLLLLTGQPVAGAILLVVGTPLAIAASLTLTSKLGLAAPSLLLEDRTAVSAIGRSWRLTKGSFWRVLGILVLAAIIQGIGAGIVSTPFSIVATIVTGGFGGDPYGSFTQNLLRLLVAGVGQTIGGAVFYPFSAAVTTLLYLDLRMRREGLDVELVRHVEGAA